MMVQPIDKQKLNDLTFSIVHPPSGKALISDKDVNNDGIKDLVQIQYGEDKMSLEVMLGTGNTRQPYTNSFF